MPTDAPLLPAALVVSADPLVRAGLRGLLAQARWAVAAEAEGLSRAASAWHEVPFDAVLWDAGQLLALGPAAAGTPPVVALVQDERAARQVLAAGLAGALLRTAEPATVGAALWAAARGLTVSDGHFSHLRPLPEAPVPATPGDFTRASARCWRFWPRGCPTAPSPSGFLSAGTR